MLRFTFYVKTNKEVQDIQINYKKGLNKTDIAWMKIKLYKNVNLIF